MAIRRSSYFPAFSTPYKMKFLILFLCFAATRIFAQKTPIPLIHHQQQQQIKWHVNFSQAILNMHMDSIQEVNLTITNLNTIPKDFTLYLRSERPELAFVDKMINSSEIDRSQGGGQWQGTFNITAIFLGQTKIYVELMKSSSDSKAHISEISSEYLEVVIIRKDRILDHAFNASVAILVSLLYINFGAALDLSAIKGIFSRPIGPAIAFFGQFVIMPLCSYILGYILFSDSVELHLGLFFTGVSPGGGASNIWTVILQGNIHLSIVMTTVSTFAAFGMMPLWIFTLGKLIFDRGNLGVPYAKIAMFAAALIIPLCIGILIQKLWPRASKFLIRILKPISIILILFIVIFAIVANFYMFKLFSWEIVLAGLGLPFFGYTLSWSIAKLLKQSNPDALAIAIETGIQNTGIAIFLLKFTLPQPQADLTTVVPVAVATMTPVPLLILYILQKLFSTRNTYDPANTVIVRHNDAD